MTGLLGRYFFTKLLRGERGRKAEPPAPQTHPLAPGQVHPRVSPQLLRIGLLHLCPLFHKLHISVQQVQPPLRVPLYHLKLILTEGGGGEDRVRTPLPDTKKPQGYELREGVASQIRPCVAGAGRQETGGNPLPFPGRAREQGRGPSRTAGSPSPDVSVLPRGVWNGAEPLP